MAIQTVNEKKEKPLWNYLCTVLAVLILVAAIVGYRQGYSSGYGVGAFDGMQKADLEIRKEVLNCEKGGGMTVAKFSEGLLAFSCEVPLP